MIGKFIKKLNLRKDLNLLNSSELFQPEWYLNQYPDINKVGIDPKEHYLLYGGFEGKNPSPEFSSSRYLENYHDVKDKKINPLIHYIRYGKNEGRNIYNIRKQKVFCIGRNKTGTTSLEKILRDFGYKLGNQAEAEMLIDEWGLRNFKKIIEYCESADAFQDIPFSLGFTFQALDLAYPFSKFILTIRNNPEEWFQSVVRSHSKLMGLETTPTFKDLENFSYRYKGWLWRQQQYVYGIDASNVYNEENYKKHYINHNQQIIEYFKFRPLDLLVLNLSEADAIKKLCSFLNIEYTGQTMPHLNKSTS